MNLTGSADLTVNGSGPETTIRTATDIMVVVLTEYYVGSGESGSSLRIELMAAKRSSAAADYIDVAR